MGTGGTAASSPQGVDADLVFSSANDLLVFHSEEMSISPEMASSSSLSEEEVRVGAGGTAASTPQGVAADLVFFSSANDLLVFHSEEMLISPEMASSSSLSEEVRVGAGGTAASAADLVFFSANDLFVFHSEEMKISPELETSSSL